MPNVSVDNKQIASHIAGVFGGRPTVQRHWDADEKSWVGILASADRPIEHVTSYATIGLSDFPIMKDGKDIGVRTEFVGACASKYPEFANMLGTAAFCVINSRWLVHPHAIFPGVVEMYRPAGPMRHLFFVPPFLWSPPPSTLTLPSKVVAWLMAVPISEGEYRHAIDEGPEALDQAFVRSQIDVFDLERKSLF
jgi:hypothetical protein